MNTFLSAKSFDHLSREVDQVFNSFFGPQILNRADLRVQSYPPLNVWEKGDTYVVESELPGVSAADIEVVVVGNELTLSGEKKSRSEEGEKYHRTEIENGKFRRVLQLPVEINADAVSATFQNGILSIELPKAESAKPKRINISSH